MKPRLSARTSRRLQLASFAAAILLLLAAWAAAQCMPPAETPLPSEEADTSISIEIDGTPAAKAEASLAPLDAACFALCGAAIVLLLAGQVQAWFSTAARIAPAAFTGARPDARILPALRECDRAVRLPHQATKCFGAAAAERRNTTSKPCALSRYKARPPDTATASGGRFFVRVLFTGAWIWAAWPQPDHSCGGTGRPVRLPANRRQAGC